MVEYEKKIPISLQEFIVIRQALCKRPVIHKQVNFYYDTDDLQMNSQSITCRIREKEGKYTATIKEHSLNGNNSSVETSIEVENEFDDSMFCDKGLKLQGCLSTQRICIFSNKEIEVVIDKNCYLDCVDFEIEIEYMPQYAQQAEKAVCRIAQFLFKNLNNKFDFCEFYDRQKCVKSKSQRFFERLAYIKSLEEGDSNETGFTADK